MDTKAAVVSITAADSRNDLLEAIDSFSVVDDSFVAILVPYDVVVKDEVTPISARSRNRWTVIARKLSLRFTDVDGCSVTNTWD